MASGFVGAAKSSAQWTVRRVIQLPAFVVVAILFLARAPRGLNRFARLIVESISDPDKKRRVTRPFSDQFQPVATRDLPGAVVLESRPGGWEQMPIPPIYGLTRGGTTSIRIGDEVLHRLVDVSFQLNSDFIRSGRGVAANEKLIRRESEWTLPADVDFVDQRADRVSLTRVHEHLRLDRAFNLCGLYAPAWAHFLISFYPKLEYLGIAAAEGPIDLVIPREFDPHFRHLISLELADKPNVRIVEIDRGTEVHCATLYHVTSSTYIADRCSYITPYAVQIAKRTTDFLADRRDRIIPPKPGRDRKLFIGRRGVRNLTNYQEILNHFLSLGFEEVFPHRLSMEEKISMFSDARWIVGPGSSGFANFVFSRPGTRILEFINFGRALETTFPALCAGLGHQFTFMTGVDVNPYDANSSYTIPLSEVRKFLTETRFLD